MRGFVASLTVLLLGCFSSRNPGSTDLSMAPDMARSAVPRSYKYVTKQLNLPGDSSDYAANLDGATDGRTKNGLGGAIALARDLAFLDVQSGEIQRNQSGDGLTLIALQSDDPSLTDDPNAVVTLYAARPFTPPIFDGSGACEIDAQVASARLPGRIAGGRFESLDPLSLSDPPTASLNIALEAGVGIAMPLVGARIQFNVRADELTNGQLNGGVRKADIEERFLPAAVRAIVNGTHDRPCGVTDCQKLKAFFNYDVSDTNISMTLQRLFGTVFDVQLFDPNDPARWKPDPNGAIKDSLSAGIGLIAVRCEFVE